MLKISGELKLVPLVEIFPRAKAIHISPLFDPDLAGYVTFEIDGAPKKFSWLRKQFPRFIGKNVKETMHIALCGRWPMPDRTSFQGNIQWDGEPVFHCPPPFYNDGANLRFEKYSIEGVKVNDRGELTWKSRTEYAISLSPLP